jgi:NAD(P)-dependent dehydrogenase (short-subunit alcohol dehydrogenase family)
VLESHNVGGFRPPSGAGFWAGGPAELIQPDAATIDYGAAKAALVNLIKTVAQEFGPRGIHVNAVFSARCPPTCGWASTAWPRQRPRSRS